MLVPRNAPHSSSIVRGWYMAAVPSGLNLTPPQVT
jgi:hypothetical protein